MKKFITETVQVLLPTRMPGTRSVRSCNGRAAAFRCAILALLVLGLLRGIGQAQEPLKVDPNGWVSIPKALAVGGDETGKLRYHFVWRSGGLDLAETNVADDRLFIQAGTGYVGIGTNHPKQNLSVAGTGYFSGNVGIGKEPTTDKLTVDGSANFSGNVGIGTNAVAGKLSVAGTGFFSGNVGIGTTTPGAKLDIGGGVLIDGTAGRNYFKDSERYDGAGLRVGGLWGMYGIFASAGMAAVGGVTGVSLQNGKVVVNDNGEVTIPGYLAVDGNLFAKSKFVYNATPGGTPTWRVLGYSSTDWARAWPGGVPTPIPSDTRLKTDLQPIPSALEKISQLRGVTFRWNEQGLQYLTRDIETTLLAGPEASDEENRKVWQAERDKQYKELSKTNVGVVAQDVEAVLPQAVTTDTSGYKSVNYTELIPLVIEALKEEDKISQEQARTIASQQTEIQRLTVANQAAQQQLNDLQDVKHKLALLEATVNNFLAHGPSGDQRSLASAGARPAADHPSGSE